MGKLLILASVIDFAIGAVLFAIAKDAYNQFPFVLVGLAAFALGHIVE
jgi:hypothetical protein